ncbi:Putative amidase domain-containing protein [Natronincola peptidivorans]|uniref:Putative amidase domain-containing protein n=1 Tax=Natronincola peptidivorans TaxID=426128 RepID=A0A1I0CBH2_9FIRM|nr:amidase domain-containing protein [Natronincola peptidivorans]SET16876.1 Putative amidase domain-containing protein [Natronincola peptidivorans]
MVIFIELKKVKIFLLFMVLLIALSIVVYKWNLSETTSSTYIDDEAAVKVNRIINLRNSALLEQDIELLESLYDIDIRSGLWAYEQELKRMTYLRQWANKQAIKFIAINSDIVVRSTKDKNEGFALNLLVSTEYQYIYEDDLYNHNSFRIGSYHSLDIMPKDDGWVISREWYKDPFADSLDLESIESHGIKQIILSGQPVDLSNLSERRLKAVAYADQYCGAASPPEYGFQYNPDYRDYNPEGGNCANFASQMLYEGAGFKKNRTWNYERGAGSKVWLNANAFNNYMLNSGRASQIAHGNYENTLKASYELLPGDYIAYEVKGKVTHISIVTGMDSKGYALVNSHNADRYRTPWDLGWSNKNIKFWLVRVHY